MRRLLPGALVALVTLFFAQGQRAFFASLFGLVYDAFFPVFRPGAAALALLPLLAVLAPLAPLARWTGRRAAVAIAAIGVAVGRLLMTDPALAFRLLGGSLVVAFAAAFLTWAVGRLDRRALAAGLVAGLVGDQLLRMGGTSYDLSLRPGWLPVQAILSLALVATAIRWYRSTEPEHGGNGLERRAGGLRLRGAIALGALLFMELHVVSSAAAIARWTGMPWGLVAGGLSLAGAAAVFLVLLAPRPTGRRGATLGLVAVLTIAPIAGLHFEGPWIAVLLATAHLAALLLVTRALDPASGRRSGAMVAAGFAVLVLATALYGVTFYAAFVLPPLAGGAPWLFAGIGLVLAGSFVLLPRPADLALGRSALPGAVGAAAVLVAAVVLGRAGQAEPGPASDGDGLRVVTWNVHYGFDEDWTFAPESMVRTLAREAPAVVALQEAIAGAPTAYGVDLPLWLGRRLGLEQHFSPTVNGLLGDAFLIRPGLGEVSARRLPAGGGDPKQLLQLRIPGPAPVTINALHLGVRAETRPAQIRAALAGIPTGPAVVLGDLNAGAASPVTTRLRAAGFADAFGGTGPPTFPAGRPRVRIDWIWTRGLTAAEPRVLDDASSDHRAVSATLHIDRDPDPEPARPAG